jgi:PadR family transcriptional regulator, regulatory protein AphA
MMHMAIASTTTNEVDEELELSAPAYVVLGMVRLGARSGYEIKRTVELSIRFFWTISQAQIYPSLQQLERAGLIEGHARPTGRRRRRVYDITAAGEEALAGWLRREQPMPFELRDIAMVKLFFAGALDRDQALSLLASVRARSEHQLDTLRQIEPTAAMVQEQGDPGPLLTLQMGIAFHRAMVEICEEFEPKFAARGSSGAARSDDPDEEIPG